MSKAMAIVYSIVFCLIIVLFSRSTVKMFSSAHNIATKKKNGISIEDSDKIAFIDAKTNFSIHFILLLGFIVSIIILNSHIIPGL